MVWSFHHVFIAREFRCQNICGPLPAAAGRECYCLESGWRFNPKMEIIYVILQYYLILYAIIIHHHLSSFIKTYHNLSCHLLSAWFVWQDPAEIVKPHLCFSQNPACLVVLDGTNRAGGPHGIPWDGTSPAKKGSVQRTKQLQSHLSKPIGSHGAAIYGDLYHQYTPNVSIYTIHGSYGKCQARFLEFDGICWEVSFQWSPASNRKNIRTKTMVCCRFPLG